MKEHVKRLLCIMLIASVSIFLAGCGSTSTPEEDEAALESSQEESEDITMDDIIDAEQGEDDNYDNGIYFEEEDDAAELTTEKKEAADFVGSWTATSGHSLYQFGNVDITVNADGTWKGNISDEDLKGSWSETDDGIYLVSELFSLSLAYTDKGTLVMQHKPDDSDEVITAVLSRK